jgi:hypothetical protein
MPGVNTMQGLNACCAAPAPYPSFVGETQKNAKRANEEVVRIKGHRQWWGSILHGEDFPRTLMGGSPAGAVEPVRHPGDTGPGCVARLSDIASSLGRPVYTVNGKSTLGMLVVKLVEW